MWSARAGTRDLSKDPCSFVWPEKVLLLLQHEDPPVFDWLSRTKRCSSAAHADVDPQVAALQAVPETVQKRQKRQTTVLHADDGASHISRQKARNVRNEEVVMEKEKENPVSYTHLTLPTIYSV